MNEQVENLRKNAQFVIDLLGRFSNVNFGLNRESVVWVEGFIECQRARPEFDSTAVNKLTPAIGSFLGECIIANASGCWRWSNDHQTWIVAFSNNSHAFPFVKVSKLFENGLDGGESIVSFYDIAVDYAFKVRLNHVSC